MLDTLAVFDPDGREVLLGSLWTDRTAVLVFVRHFGCLFCRQQVAELEPLLEAVRSRGAELFLIGHGSISEARGFRDEVRTAIPLFTDPGRQSYRALGMRRGVWSVANPGVWLRAARALRAGFRQTRVAGDAFQQGGVLVIDPQGVERFRYISRSAGDHPAPASILNAL